MCRTPPKIWDDGSWDGSFLRAREDTVAWVAAQCVLGSWWNKDEDANEIKPQETNTDETSKGKGRKATGEEKRIEEKTKEETKKLLAKLYPKKTEIKNSKKVTIAKDWNRTHTVYVKWRSPRLRKSSMEDLEEEVVNHFKTMLNYLYKLDSSLIVIPWVTHGFHPIFKDSKILTRDDLERYVDRIFVKTGMFVWCRLQIGFNVSQNKIFEDDGLSGYQMTLTKEPIQDKYLSMVDGS